MIPYAQIWKNILKLSSYRFSADFFCFSDVYLCSTILKNEQLIFDFIYFCKITVMVLDIFSASLVFADLKIGFLGDA